MTRNLTVKEMSDAQRLAYHQEAEGRIQSINYEKPPPFDRPKKIEYLVKSGELSQSVQVVKEGGENNLHYHTSMNQTYFVLKGRVQFWGPDDVVLGAFGPHEGIYIPAGSRYRFASIGDEDLELLQTIAIDKSAPESSRRINVETKKDWMLEDHLQENDPSMVKA